jgi:radical SAM superfamily enzyme YgiQ (UPF0313 family)
MNQFQQKKILLINPPIEDFYQTKIRQEPLGLGYLAAVLRRAGFDVVILDAFADSSRQTIALPESLKYLRPHYPTQDLSPFKLFTNYFHFGKSWKQLEKEIARAKPDLIGITANFTPYFEMAQQVARICKQLFPRIPVVAGGHHVTARPESALNAGDFDYVVLGEGEKTFSAFAHAWFFEIGEKVRQLPGIAFQHGESIQINSPAPLIEHLDNLPYPDAVAGSTTKMVLTSRGCPLKCDFCTIQKVMGRKIRVRAIESVLDEIEYWQNQGVREIDFEDDNFLFYPERAARLLEAIVSRFGERKLRLSAMNGISATKLDESLLQLLAQAGFEWLNLPLVSGNLKIQRQIHRNQSREHFLEIVRKAAVYNLKIVGYLILGLPDDTLENMIRDILTLAQERVLIGPSVFYPPPGSPVFEACVARNYIQPHTFSRFRASAFSVETENFSRTDLVTLFRLVRLINYLKELIDSGQLNPENRAAWLGQHSPLEMVGERRLEKNQIGVILLREFFWNQRLAGMKMTDRRGNQFKYEMIEYTQSRGLVAEMRQQLVGLNLKGVTSNREAKI